MLLLEVVANLGQFLRREGPKLPLGRGPVIGRHLCEAEEQFGGFQEALFERRNSSPRRNLGPEEDRRE